MTPEEFRAVLDDIEEVCARHDITADNLYGAVQLREIEFILASTRAKLDASAHENCR